MTSNPILQVIVSGSPTSAFTIPPGFPRTGMQLRCNVNGREVSFARTSATAVALRNAAPPRALVDFYEMPSIGSAGGVFIASLDFPSIAPAGTADLTVALQGAEVGDTVSLGLPSSVPAGVIYQAFVSAAGVITVRATNVTAGAIDPVAGSFRVAVSKD